jgi:2-polyprenyl-3-methyl-5-hydroxy-6-metoxy-1,4-benzoquinol methylase
MHRKKPLAVRGGLAFAGLAIFLFVLCAGVPASQGQPQVQAQPQAAKPAPDEEQIWKDFLTFFRAAPGDPAEAMKSYEDELGRQGVSRQEIDRRFEVIWQFIYARPDIIEIVYDKTFSRTRTPTGHPEQDGFASTPSQFMISAVKGLKPARALDVGMGQGRNAVELARQGWDVTGFDISGEGVAAASRNAEAAGVSIRAIKADYASFDFGREAWDLIVMTFAWAPVEEPAFVGRIKTSLRPGGLVVFENFVSTPERPYAPMIHALAPGALRECFAGFEIVSYEELTDTGDWGGPGSRLVRMIARRL